MLALILASTAGLLGGCRGLVAGPTPTVTLAASPGTISTGDTVTLTWSSGEGASASIDNGIGNVSLEGSTTVSPAQTTTYTITVQGSGSATATAQATVTIGTANVNSINHVVFMLQENRSFDSYFGMLNPYRKTNKWNLGDDGKDYEVDGIDDKLSQISNADDEGNAYPLFKFIISCIDDES
jgi:phospholipase C